MAICHFCTGEFGSEQGVKSHMRKCDLYQADKRKKAAASGSLPKGAATPAATLPVQSSPPVGAPDLTAPLHDLMKSISERSTKRDAPQTPQQLRRSILQATKAQVIDRHWTPLGQVTSAMRGYAKAKIEQELSSLPLEELPFEEVLEFAAAIRDRIYEPAYRKQAREAERQQAAQEARRRKEVEEFAAGHRADRRKMTLIEQAIGQARARCEAQQIVGWDRLGVLVDIESRLKELLTGGEPVPDAQVIIQCVIEARFIEAAAKQEAAQAKATERWYEEKTALLVLGALTGLVVLALKFPAHTLAILNWIQRAFGLTPGAEAAAPTPGAAETTPPAANAEARPRSKRWRKYPVAPPSPASPWTPSAGPEPGHA